MTAQILDTANFQEYSHLVVGYAPKMPFDPVAHGYSPVATTTACYRGWACEFEVGHHLVLTGLTLSHQPSEVPASRKIPPPDLGGVKAMPALENPVGSWRFVGLGLPLPFTGGLILGRLSDSPFQGIPAFHHVLLCDGVTEIVFDSGRLVTAVDRSSAANRLKQELCQASLSGRKTVPTDQYLERALSTALQGYRFL